jgi:hypothetical protein
MRTRGRYCSPCSASISAELGEHVVVAEQAERMRAGKIDGTDRSDRVPEPAK